MDRSARQFIVNCIWLAAFALTGGCVVYGLFRIVLSLIAVLSTD